MSLKFLNEVICSFVTHYSVIFHGRMNYYWNSLFQFFNSPPPSIFKHLGHHIMLKSLVPTFNKATQSRCPKGNSDKSHINPELTRSICCTTANKNSHSVVLCHTLSKLIEGLRMLRNQKLHNLQYLPNIP